MNSERIMEAISGISDRHILEFAEVKPKEKSDGFWVKLALTAACFGLVVLAIPMLLNLIAPSRSSPSATPYVRVNGMVYVIDPNYPDTATLELPEKYVVIGTVERNPSPDESREPMNGDASGCQVGDKIYQAPGSYNEIYVYTRLFSGSEEYRYLRFLRKDP